MTFVKSLTISSILLLSFFSFLTAHAATLTDDAVVDTCLSFQQDLSYLSTDAQTNGDVSKLQGFLIGSGSNFRRRSAKGVVDTGEISIKNLIGHDIPLSITKSPRQRGFFIIYIPVHNTTFHPILCYTSYNTN